jgi:methyltransferase (TIGR00027 family)
MTPSDHKIEHVSDTALMVAACRAIETARPLGFVRDPFAERLAGERGMALARNLAAVELMCFGVGMRSRFLDELLMRALAPGELAAVISLGCGLDARPYRLDLPADLLWIEADFADMLDYKDGVLASQTPRCRVERIPADLADAAARRAVFSAAAGLPALMITEGLLMYLPAATVEALATEAPALGNVRRWLLDVTSARLMNRMYGDSFHDVENVRAEGHLKGEAVLDVARRNGWTEMERRTYVADGKEIVATRLKAMFGDKAPRQDDAAPPDDPSGVHLFGCA